MTQNLKARLFTACFNTEKCSHGLLKHCSKLTLEHNGTRILVHFGVYSFYFLRTSNNVQNR